VRRRGGRPPSELHDADFYSTLRAADYSVIHKSRRKVEALADPLGKDPRAVGVEHRTAEEDLHRRARALATSVISRPGATSMSGGIAFIGKPASKREAVRPRHHRRETLRRRRSYSASPTALARAPRIGANCCSIWRTDEWPAALVIADGVLGFWRALGEVWPTT
jgi:hypothetical protein